MNRRAQAFALAAVVAAGCADNRTTIEIKGRAAPGDAATCTFTPGGEFQSGPGLMDVQAGGGTYAAMLYLKNNAADPATANPGSVTDSKAWRANAAKVRVNPSDYISDFPPSPALAGFSGENTLPLDGQTTAPNANSVQYVDMVGSALGAQLAGAVAAGTRGRVVLGVTLLGQTLDGAMLDTAEWYFALDVCNGCLGPASAACVAPAVAKAGCFGFYQDPKPFCQ